jgi:hydrogenase expression/formation protein HypE
LGTVAPDVHLSVTRARPGDAVLVSGYLGDHGIAIMVEREGIELEGELLSDAAPLTGLVQHMLEVEPGIRCLRDPTRGGLASALNEIALASRVGIALDERQIPVRPAVRGVCELLGFDPLYVACEGRLVAVVPETSAEKVLLAMRAHPLGRDAAIIGQVREGPAGRVTERTSVGGERVVIMLAGEQLPRIC